jgi:hypothetical protein
MFARDSHRAPIFYDTNNTGYYVDPNSNSQFSAVYADNFFRPQGATGVYWQSYDTRIFSDNTNYLKSRSDNGWVIYDRSAGLRGYLYFDGSGFGLLHSSGGWAVRTTPSLNELYNITLGNDFRAYIYYDRDDTAYYINPATNGRIWQMGIGYQAANGARFSVTGGHGDSTIRITAQGNLLGTGATSAMQWWVSEPGVTWNDGGFGYNVQNDGGSPGGFGRINTSFGQAYMRFTTNGTQVFYNTNTSGTRYENMSTRPDHTVYVNNYLEAGNSLRAPIFYDSNNTGFYIDPNSSTQLSLVLANNWFRAQGDSGFYTQDYGGHLRRSVSASYGTWEVFGYNKGGYAGINIIDPQGYWNNYMHESGNGGLYIQNLGGKWVFYYSRGNNCVGIGSSATVGGGYAARINDSLYVNSTCYIGGASYSQIHYDANDTFYVLDPNGTTRLWYVEIRSLLSTFGIGGRIDIAPNQGSFGGYIRSDRHLVIETVVPGHHTYVLDVGTGVGVVRLYGNQFWQAHSDRTLKTVHSNITNVLEKLETITPVYYSFNNVENDKNRIGLIAQEVQIHYPELVDTEPMHDKLVLDYTGMVPVLLAAIKELKAELNIVKEELNTLKNK